MSKTHTVIIIETESKALITVMPNVVSDDEHGAALRAYDSARRMDPNFVMRVGDAPAELAVPVFPTDSSARSFTIHGNKNTPTKANAIAVVVPHSQTIGSLLPG